MSDGIISFKEDHLLKIALEDCNQDILDMIKSGLAKKLELTDSVTFMSKGYPMVCGGITSYWHGRGQLWTAFSKHSKLSFVPTFRAIKRWVDFQLKNNFKRIELSIDCDFPTGRRRAEMLGFSLECELARKYLPNGKDCSLYSLVRED